MSTHQDKCRIWVHDDMCDCGAEEFSELSRLQADNAELRATLAKRDAELTQLRAENEKVSAKLARLTTSKPKKRQPRHPLLATW
jgi:cell shape-determining protein MreC